MSFNTGTNIWRTSLLTFLISSPVIAETLEQKLARLEKALEAQQTKILEQERKLSAQARFITQQREILDRQRSGLQLLRDEMLSESRAAGISRQPENEAHNSVPEKGVRLAQKKPQNKPDGQPPLKQKPVGQAPPKKKQEAPKVQAIAEIGGVLTPKGKLTLEPTLQYSHADVNRFTFRGIEFIGALGIGLLEAGDADRDAYYAILTGRLGVTNRMELELKVPYLYREDTLTDIIPQLSEPEEDPVTLDREQEGDGLGDIELALHYQLNSGQDGWPFFIANFRYKSTTGEGPFDLNFDADGITDDLATGSGFHSVEPSLTLLYPSDPVVYFANIGYLFNLEDDIDKRVGEVNVGEVDPGDAFRISFGMAYSINERTSFTLGYKNDFIRKTRTEFIDPDTGASSTQSSADLNIGALLLGYAFQTTPRVGFNLNLELGITDDAPDVLISLRMPLQYDLY